MIPAIVGSAAVQINVLVNTNFASQISDPVRGADGPVSWLAYAFRFMQFPLGIFGVSFASAILPSVSRSVAANDYGEFRRTVSRSLGLIFMMTIPSSIGLVLLGAPIIGAVFQAGKFQIYDTQQTALALSCYSVGLVGYAASKVLNPAFYALTDAKTPLYVSLCSIGINISFAEVLLKKFHVGIAALALSTSAVAVAAFVILFAILRRRIGGIEGRYLMDRFLRIGTASLMMAAPVWACNAYLTHRLGQSRWADLANLAVSLPVGVACFALAANWLGVEEIRLARDAVGRRLASARARIRN
jgi:putative peptidoglycan lipid II flippase